MAAKVKLAGARARMLAPAPGREAVPWDADIPGFGLRAHRRVQDLNRAPTPRAWQAQSHAGIMCCAQGRRDVERRAHARRQCDGEQRLATAPTLQAFSPVLLSDCAPWWNSPRG